MKLVCYARALNRAVVLLLCAQPDKMLNKTALTKDFRRVAKSIIKNTETNFYRPDLTKGTLLLRLLPATPRPHCVCAVVPLTFVCVLVLSPARQVEPDRQGAAQEEGRQVSVTAWDGTIP